MQTPAADLPIPCAHAVANDPWISGRALTKQRGQVDQMIRGPTPTSAQKNQDNPTITKGKLEEKRGSTQTKSQEQKEKERLKTNQVLIERKATQNKNQESN